MRRTPRTRALTLLLPVLALAGPAVAGVAAQQAGQAASQEAESAVADGPLLNRADSVRIVLADSPTIVLTEFVDFACSDCRAFEMQRGDSLRALVRDEDVVYAFRVYPIPRLLRGTQGAEAAFCAGGIGGREAFEAMRQRLFARQPDWARLLDPTPVLLEYGREVGLPDEAFAACLQRDAVAPLISADIRQAVLAGLRGTPMFVFGRVGADEPGEIFYGNQPMARFREAIRKLREAPPATR